MPLDAGCEGSVCGASARPRPGKLIRLFIVKSINYAMVEPLFLEHAMPADTPYFLQ